ncbi:hypothetical protein [Cyclobacterium plantarum]|uniref:Lipocalin-like domain-containing protein n=1 Tax=Cyclobacterium plantarum TaxID=2716263 RepID=A0ABX0H9K9_9BACT|nr:hypothetical protein [Cyclobacterium plantarum]NHE56911.1 hypothetical protein [Cyclobacterium plantarum]
MKSAIAYPMLAFFLFHIACTDSEAPILPGALTGTWIERFDLENQDSQLLQEETINFYDNGAYEHWMGYRDPETNVMLGYRHYAEGIYLLEGRRLMMRESKRLLHVGGTFYGQLDQLSPVSPYAETSADLKLIENGTRLEMHLSCNPVSSARCNPKKTFNKLGYFQ